MQTRSIPKMLLLTIVTLGFYQLYWLYKTRQEMVARGIRIPPFLVLFLPILSLLVVAIVSFVTRFVLSTVSESSSFPFIDLLIVIGGVVAFSLLIPIALYWFYKYCKAVESVTDGLFQFDMNYFMLILLSLFGLAFIWPFVVQSYFNRIPVSNLDLPY